MKQTAIKHGIIAGLAIVLLLLGAYFLDPKLFLNPMVYWGSLLIPVLAMVRATKLVREEKGGKIGQREAISSAFQVWVVAMVIFQVFMFAMFHFDENLTPTLREMMRAARGDKAAADVVQMTIGQAFLWLCFMFLPGFLFSYMVASFLKK